MALALRFSARSDVGLLREGNEDSAYAGPRLLVVADGMGGHAAGEVASSVAVATLSTLDEDAPGPDLLDRLAFAVEEANSHLRDMVQGDAALQGMGTTVTALLRAGARFGLVHVGDSRCYLLRAGQLQQVTRDHTFVQALIDEGRITAEEADHHPQRSVITNALDGRGDVIPDLSIREVRAGDRWMLCSDGLSGVVGEQTMQETLSRGDPDSAAAALVELALRGGGPDNITVIVADVVDVESSPSDIPQVVGAAASGPVRHHRDGPGPSSPAAKAAALSASTRAPRLDAPDELTHPSRRRWGRITALLIVLLLAVGGGGWGAWTWSRQQYYVGAQDGRVAIFQGLMQNVLGVSLSTRYAEQDIEVQDLSTFSRTRVQEGIAAGDLTEARRIVARLRDEAAPTPVPTPTPTPTATPGTTPTPIPTPTPTPGATPTSIPTPGAGLPRTPSPGTSSTPTIPPPP